MDCRNVLDRIEAVAAGDEPATAELRAHLEGCVACAAALAEARRIETALSARPAPAAPARFSAILAGRIRQERWRSEQQVDRVFNLALLLGVVAVVAGVFALFNVDTLTAAFAGTVTVLNRVTSQVAADALPVFRRYVMAAAFLATALLVWWWAERRLSL